MALVPGRDSRPGRATPHPTLPSNAASGGAKQEFLRPEVRHLLFAVGLLRGRRRLSGQGLGAGVANVLSVAMAPGSTTHQRVLWANATAPL
jgi:hypothetical protein